MKDTETKRIWADINSLARAAAGGGPRREWAAEKESIEARTKAFPDINVEALDRITMLQHDESAGQDSPLLRQTFRDAMVFAEDLNDRLVAEAGVAS